MAAEAGKAGLIRPFRRPRSRSSTFKTGSRSRFRRRSAKLPVRGGFAATHPRRFSMKIWIVLCAAALSMAVPRQPAAAEDGVGVRQIKAASSARGGNLDVTVWYPAQSGGASVLLGESVFFQGTAARLVA